MSVVTSCSALPIGLRCLPASRAPGRPQLFHAPLAGTPGGPARPNGTAEPGTSPAARGEERRGESSALRSGCGRGFGCVAGGSRPPGGLSVVGDPTVRSVPPLGSVFVGGLGEPDFVQVSCLRQHPASGWLLLPEELAVCPGAPHTSLGAQGARGAPWGCRRRLGEMLALRRGGASGVLLRGLGGHGASDGLWVPQPAHSACPRGICSVGAFGSPRMLRPLCAGVLV